MAWYLLIDVRQASCSRKHIISIHVHAAYQTILSAWHFLYCLLLHKSEFETASLHQQLFKDMSPPTKELMKLTLEEKLAHGGHPVLRWMMDNIYIRTDPAGNI